MIRIRIWFNEIAVLRGNQKPPSTPHHHFTINFRYRMRIAVLLDYSLPWDQLNVYIVQENLCKKVPNIKYNKSYSTI